jgi:hypothetical protein
MTKKRLLHRVMVPLGLLCFGLAPSISRADITFTMNPVTTNTNAGDFAQVNATTIDALNLNQNQALGQNTPILQIVTDQAATIQGNGQSFIVAADSTKPFGDVVMTPINPPISGFTTLELNPYSNAGVNGSFYLLATDNNGTVFDSRGPDLSNPQYFTFDSNGQNRFAAVASNGETITKLEMVVSPPSADILKQFRLDYVLAGTNPAPEPSTIALTLSGLGTMGLMHLRRRRQAAKAAV